MAAGLGWIVAAGAGFGQEPAADGAWKGSVAAGLSFTEGNSETLTGNASAMGQRNTAATGLRLGVEGSYAEADGERTTENAKAYAAAKRKYEAFYLYTDDSVLYDRVADLDYRLILGAGAGRYLADRDEARVGFELGLAYVREKYGDEPSGDFIALRLAHRGEWKLSETARVWEAVEYLPAADDRDRYLVNAEAGVEAVLRDGLSLRVVVRDRYDSTPAEGRKGNDVAVTGSLVYAL